MSVKIRKATPHLDAWHYAAPQLANLSALPKWAQDHVATGGEGKLYVIPYHGGDPYKITPGDWLVRHAQGGVGVVTKAEFDRQGWEIVP